MWEDPSENAERTREKQQAADRAVECVESGMVVGLGAGSTAILAVRRIGQLLREGRLRDIVGVPCSSAIEAEARVLGIPITLDPPGAVDLTIDGADEVDPELNLIKGGGGRCYTRKSWPRPVSGRSLSSMRGSCRRFLAPTGRCRSRSSRLGALPEALPRIPGRSRHRTTAARWHAVQDRSGQPDSRLRFRPIPQPAELAAKLDARTGIVEHGLFIGLATEVIVASVDGIRHLTPPRAGHRAAGQGS